MPCMQHLELLCLNASGSSDVSANTRKEAAASECQGTLRPGLSLGSGYTVPRYHPPHTHTPRSWFGDSGVCAKTI